MVIGIDARSLISKTPSGIGVYLWNIIKYINAENDNNKYILYMHRESENDLSLLNPNIVIRVIPNISGTLFIRCLLRKYLIQDKVDVFWGPAHICPKKTKGIRCVLTIHDLALLINPQWGSWSNSLVQNILVRRTIHDADSIIAISESTKNDIIKFSSFPNEKISIIYNGGYQDYLEVSAESKEAVFKKYSIRDKYFLYIGNIEPRKNIDHIISAFETISKEYNDYKLYIAGSLAWKYKPIIALIHNSAVKDSIKMIGYVSKDVKAILLQNAEAFLFPSHYEGFGIPIVEAMSNKTIVITDRNSSLPEVAGNAALYVDDENDSAAIADKMREAIRMTSQERKMRINTGTEYCRNFTWKICAEKTYQELINYDHATN
jgi:glycosyltransferase involved in cell wall biosynthesis